MITVVTVGAPRGPLADAIRAYEDRAGRYWKLRTVEVPAGTGGGRDDPEAVRRAEGERLRRAISAEAATVVLTRAGRGLTSRGLVRYLEARLERERRSVAFVVGGAYGVDSRVREDADFLLTLSPLTLPHDLARLVLAEQLYRAGTIRRGEPYHKEDESRGGER